MSDTISNEINTVGVDAASEAFEKWWAVKKAEGYQYGPGPTATVRFGFEAGYEYAIARPTETREGTPLCPVHKRIDEHGTLEMEISGLNCLACTLQERVELLALIAPFADGSKDSVTVLREIADFWDTHHGEGRAVVSYPVS